MRAASANFLGDADALAYIAAVEAADGQALESGVKDAINAFVVGCKDDNIWTAIKASCILAGARTLAGALVPLVGAAPTNVGPFGSGDYNRKTGLVGGSTKYLNANRNNTDDPLNSSHASIYISTAGSGTRSNISTPANGSLSEIALAGGVYVASRSNDNRAAGADNTTGFIGLNRSSSASFSALNNATSYTYNVPSVVGATGAWNLYRRSGGALYSNARLSFYSIGESIILALLRDRVTALINAYAAAIP